MDWASALRAQLRERAESMPEAGTPTAYRSLGKPATVLFQRSDDGTSHGNFLPSAWAAISANPAWARRIEKPHSRVSALPPSLPFKPREMDSTNSSDALLMNCFCYPGAAPRAARVLGASPEDSVPNFGFMPRLALLNGRTDETEIDMCLGDTLVEAKLTEATFTERPKGHVLRYKAFTDVFNVDLLPGSTGTFAGYQLIRNVLASVQLDRRLVVLIDYRRPDLLKEWWQVHGAIVDGQIRRRCSVTFWQEVAAACQPIHRKQLADKYGI